ncbi:YbhB/YbcL family Raf kinase inhibitor-like protein [Altererythrobacter sp. TH136]|uniref:YbhB/YbcL family Raf kinase inhibitor-like protein n=1 Tax=Altererythrobacter sp. TH136 TaxID=2067415 RepID=UPI0011626326|nr:YbhB/YbcL family Raf kinase inhibitor-like protein [Altererythrobacter sp. TH136]QDM40520.1 YbhB/YbcL family Raf kinase inhibitor-like protein [Altererythrobacter sp. TH136]
MLEHVPAFLGRALKNVRAGHGKLAVARLGAEDTLHKGGFALTSAAFADGEELDPMFTADEEDACAPPLAWTAPPAGTRQLALIVEDPDAPSPEPLVHLIGWGFDGKAGDLFEGDEPPMVGLNSYNQAGWLAPDPPTGHGVHDYVFQLFALDRALDLQPGAGRSALVEAMEGHVLAAAVLTGTYRRAS